MQKIAVYPGSFDPCTNGHLDIIIRAAKMFDQVNVAVSVNAHKVPTFTMEERIGFLKRVTADIPNVQISSFDGLLVNYMHEIGASVIVKGLRAMSDFEYEFQQALINKKLNPDVETVFMTTSSENSFLSSSVVKEVGALGGSLKGLVPKAIQEQIIKKL